ncbi:hypothetical protein K474DRAFT_713585 [Panus rudis PR-1116 ss-1]|nr:hypothetical protein K474DRAFT_713585 [Panus rudis PR-1116 ss-1]
MKDLLISQLPRQLRIKLRNSILHTLLHPRKIFFALPYKILQLICNLQQLLLLRIQYINIFLCVVKLSRKILLLRNPLLLLALQSDQMLCSLVERLPESLVLLLALLLQLQCTIKL